MNREDIYQLSLDDVQDGGRHQRSVTVCYLGHQSEHCGWADRWCQGNYRQVESASYLDKQLCDITAIRASMTNNRLEGVTISPDDLGETDIFSLDAAYCKISGYVADAAAEESARIQQQKLQAAEIMKFALSIKLKTS